MLETHKHALVVLKKIKYSEFCSIWTVLELKKNQIFSHQFTLITTKYKWTSFRITCKKKKEKMINIVLPQAFRLFPGYIFAAPLAAAPVFLSLEPQALQTRIWRFSDILACRSSQALSGWMGQPYLMPLQRCLIEFRLNHSRT